MTLSILFQTASVCVVDKPSGMAVHRGYDNDGPFVLQTLRDQLGRHVYPVHRLDRATSGVLVMALDAETAGQLGAAFTEGQVEKQYVAIVRGRPPAEGLIDHDVPKSEDGERVRAVTAFRTLGTSGRFSLVECRPLTGRYHQIRRHMKHLSHPLVGDVNYGKGDINRLFRSEYGLSRLALHASRLTAPSVALDVAAPLPSDFAEALGKLGLLDLYPAP